MFPFTHPILLRPSGLSLAFLLAASFALFAGRLGEVRPPVRPPDPRAFGIRLGIGGYVQYWRGRHRRPVHEITRSRSSKCELALDAVRAYLLLSIVTVGLPVPSFKATTRSMAGLSNVSVKPLGQRISIQATLAEEPSPKCTRRSLLEL